MNTTVLFSKVMAVYENNIIIIFFFFWGGGGFVGGRWERGGRGLFTDITLLIFFQVMAVYGRKSTAEITTNTTSADKNPSTSLSTI